MYIENQSVNICIVLICWICYNKTEKEYLTCRLRVFDNRVLRRIFGPKRDEVTGEWRKLHNEELNDMYCSPKLFGWPRVFDNRVLRRIFGPKRDEVTGEWRKLHNEELNDMYFFFLLALQPPLGVIFYSPLVGFSLLACEVSWSHTTTRHIR